MGEVGAVDEAGFYRPSAHEVLTCWMGGFDPVALPVPVATDPRAGFEAALLPALRRSPCLVAFSGGRDSSAVLAVATALARRHGLPDPVPVTHDFAGSAHADELRYQETLVRTLQLDAWLRIRDPHAADVLGDRARAGLSRFGLLWPAMLHCHQPLMQLAAGGGAVVTGEGGDEVLGTHRMAAVNYVRQRRRLPGPRTIRLLAEAFAPAPVRRWHAARRLSEVPMHPWLAPEVSAQFVRELARDHAGAPLRWDLAVLRNAGRRASTAAAANFRALFATEQVSYHEPFLDPAFLGPLHRAGGRRGWLNRTAMMRMLFSDVLPDEICRRTSKAQFGSVAVGEPSRDFISGWDGSGVDPEVVDVAKFRAAVNAEVPVHGVQLLLQALWLATARSSAVPALPGVPA